MQHSQYSPDLNLGETQDCANATLSIPTRPLTTFNFFLFPQLKISRVRFKNMEDTNKNRMVQHISKEDFQLCFDQGKFHQNKHVQEEQN